MGSSRKQTRPAEAARVNADGRALAGALIDALADLREDVATFLRYMGSVDDYLDRGDVEVARNILNHQRRNLKAAIEKTGPIDEWGYAGRTMKLDVGEVRRES